MASRLPRAVQSGPALRVSRISATPHVSDLGAFDLSLSRASPAASFGAAHIGAVQLPHLLQNALDTTIKATSDKKAIRLHALALYTHLRNTRGSLDRQLGVPEKRIRSIRYDHPTALAYAAGVMPDSFSSSLRVFKEVARRISMGNNAWRPTHIVDWGSGTASNAWAAACVWHDYSHYIGIERASAAQALSLTLLQPLKHVIHTELYKTDVRMPFQDYLDSGTRPSLAPNPKTTLAVASLTLSELSDSKSRRKMLENMWNSNAEVIVLVERGNPRGFDIIAEAREFLLHIGDEQAYLDSVPRDDIIKVGHEIYLSESYMKENKDNLPQSSHVVAPCPHDGTCPVENSRVRFCHFAQFVEIPYFLRKTKVTSKHSDIASFSYVVIRRGQRPKATEATGKATSLLSTNWKGPKEIVSTPPRSLSEITEKLTAPLDNSQTIAESLSLQKNPDEPNEIVPLSHRWELLTPDEKASLLQDMTQDSSSWVRIVQPPKKARGHVTMDVCSPKNGIERLVVTKSQGKQPYYDARKAQWGDIFPHEAKVADHGKRHRERERAAATGLPKSVRAERIKYRQEIKQETLLLENLIRAEDDDISRSLLNDPQDSSELVLDDPKADPPQNPSQTS